MPCQSGVENDNWDQNLLICESARHYNSIFVRENTVDIQIGIDVKRMGVEEHTLVQSSFVWPEDATMQTKQMWLRWHSLWLRDMQEFLNSDQRFRLHPWYKTFFRIMLLSCSNSIFILCLGQNQNFPKPSINERMKRFFSDSPQKKRSKKVYSPSNVGPVFVFIPPTLLFFYVVLNHPLPI